MNATTAMTTAELAALDAREERVRELEADRDALLASYAEVVPEALEGLSGEERMRVYEMLQLEVRPDPEGYEVSGALCNRRPRGTRSSVFAQRIVCRQPGRGLAASALSLACIHPTSGDGCCAEV
jgi:hypothetical protein